MPQRRHRWQLIVFAGAILIPSAALVVVSQRTIEQNRELAGKRRLDEQRATKQRIAQAMIARLAALKRAVAANPGATASSEVALVARVEGDHLVMPWESDAAARRFLDSIATPPGFASSVRAGEQAEFGNRDLNTAAGNYRTALRHAVTPVQSAYARILLARALQKAHHEEEAVVEARQVLTTPAEWVDEDGVPLAAQAAALLTASREDQPEMRRALERAVGDRSWLSPIATFNLQNLAEQIERETPAEDRPWIMEFRRRLARSVSLQEQAHALDTHARMLGLLEPSGSSGRPAWTLYPGAEPWLVAAESADGATALLIAVWARDVFRPFEAAGNLRFHTSAEPGGELLADSIAGLKVSFPSPPGRDSSEARITNWLFYAALFVLVAATAFGASLLWRSFRSEMELAETRSQFVASISHELKTPLTAIRMYAETLQMGRPQDRQVQHEYLETITNECERLSRLVDNVLLFSKIEQGKNVYRFRPISVADTLRTAARTLSYPLAQHGFALRMELDVDLPQVRGDPDALEQAILNLLTNAMKYSGAKKEIDVRLARRNGETTIEVRDYGIGISAEERGRIFDKYYRAPTSENQTIPGTGLGLTLVAQIAKAHGGRVEVESEPGRGSTFTIHLPLGTQA